MPHNDPEMNVDETREAGGLELIESEALTLPSLIKVEQSSPRFRNPAHVYLASLDSPESRRGMTAQLRKVARIFLQDDNADFTTLPWHQLRFEHVNFLKSRLVEAGQAPATVRVAMAAVRGVMQAAFNLEQISADDLQRILSAKAPKGARLLRGRALSHGEISALFRVCYEDRSPAGRRDAAIFAIMSGAGLRREEVSSLMRENLDLGAQPSVRLIGKGNKEREVPLPFGGLVDAMLEWFEVRGDQEGPLYHPINKGGKVQSDRRLSPEGIYHILQVRYAQAGLKRCSPHDFRRTYTSHLLEIYGDISIVQKLMGHANINTTARYDMRDQSAKRKAVQGIHIPFRPKGGK